MPRTRTITEIPFEWIERRFALASYWFGGKWCPAVTAKDGGYQIRVLKSEYRSGASLNATYDYFYLDDTGLITNAPRGYAAEYSRRVRVSDIAEAAGRFAVPDESATKIRLGF